MNTLLEPFPEDWRRALAIVAHPDDLEFGVSSAIAKWTAAGKQVVYVLATRGEAGIDALSPDECGPLREAEERDSARLVGVDTVEFLGYRDGVVEYGLPLRRDLARMIRRYRPEVVIASNFELSWPGGKFNQGDHRAVGLATLDATLDAGNRWIFPELLAEGLEPWKAGRVFAENSPSATHACDVGATIERGIAALRAHRAYLEHLGPGFDAATFLREQAALVGPRLGCRYAVEFQAIKV